MMDQLVQAAWSTKPTVVLDRISIMIPNQLMTKHRQDMFLGRSQYLTVHMYIYIYIHIIMYDY